MNTLKVSLTITLVTLVLIGLSQGVAVTSEDETDFTTDFMIENCKFKNQGENPFFILKPGYKLILEGEDDGEEIRVEITVLRETENLNLDDIGKVKTRVIEEREWVDDELAEVSRNFFAICKNTNSVFYFGEDVDNYEDGEIINHDGAWRAGEDDAMPGVLMPGTFLLGSRYFQEMAPGEAMDQGENVAMGLVVETEADTFAGCVEVLETTPLEPGEESTKIYAPGIGLIVDDDIELVDYGYFNKKGKKIKDG